MDNQVIQHLLSRQRLHVYSLLGEDTQRLDTVTLHTNTHTHMLILHIQCLFHDFAQERANAKHQDLIGGKKIHRL